MEICYAEDVGVREDEFCDAPCFGFRERVRSPAEASGIRFPVGGKVPVEVAAGAGVVDVSVIPFVDEAFGGLVVERAFGVCGLARQQETWVFV